MSASGDSSHSALELFPKVAAHVDPGSTAARVANSQLLSLSVQQIKACVYIEDFNLPFEELFKCQSSSSVKYHVRYTFPWPRRRRRRRRSARSSWGPARPRCR